MTRRGRVPQEASLLGFFARWAAQALRAVRAISGGFHYMSTVVRGARRSIGLLARR